MFLYRPLVFSICVLLASTFSLAEAEEKRESKDADPPKISYPADIFLYRAEGDTHVAQRVSPESRVGGTFVAKHPFGGVALCCPSYSNNIGALTLSLFVWDETFAQSVARPPLAKKRFEDFRDNASLRLDFPTLPPGEYLWTLDEARENVGVWRTLDDLPNVRSFADDAPISGCFEAKLFYSDAPFPFSGTQERFEKLLENQAEIESKPSSVPVAPEWELYADTWDAIDGLGRKVARFEEAGARRPKKVVGIFYWTWHNWNGDVRNYPPKNNAQILKKHPEAIRDVDHPAWGALFAPHHWDEPLLGYYSTIDRWVLRRHAQWLVEAGVDVVIFDATNGTHTWMDSSFALFETFAQMRKEGQATPQFAFMLPFSRLDWTRDSLVQLYRDIYRDGKFQDLWFCWQGKPLILARPEAVEKDTWMKDENLNATNSKNVEIWAEWENIRQFFTFRPCQPSYTRGPERPDQWCWLEVFPQNGYVLRSDGSFEMAGVGVAQNHSIRKKDGGSGLAAMNDANVFGRAYIVGADGENINPSKDPMRFVYGDNFAQQWTRALEIDPEFLFITGWNEGIASRFLEWNGTTNAFPDQFSPEFSRDAEPSAGILKDHFYYQMADGIRKFKGVRPQKRAGENPIYRDAIHDTTPRRCAGYGETFYTNETGRNDLRQCFVTHDEQNVIFAVETTDPLTPPTDSAWMRLFVRVATLEGAPTWEGFHFALNLTPPDVANSRATLEKSLGGWSWTPVAKVAYTLEKNRLTIVVPRQILEMGEKIDLHFKWSDNMQNDGDILDFYQNGDTAPDGRFMYRYFE
ncbi:MAG: hypothetical protein Q4D38_09845 [Planctomycetia bacterium]|nr:hypothetical protein [Planctomycetia bacterium]